MKKEKIIYILVPILLFIASIIAYKYAINIKDSMKFKNEYESYNGKKIYGDTEYIKLNINYNNPIKYSSYKEIFDILKNKTGIIFLGSPKVQDSRNIVNTLISVANSNKISKIYYLDITNDMESLTIQDNEIVYEVDKDGNELKGTEEYHKLLELLDEYAINYTIEYDDNVFSVENKKIYIPSVIFVRNGSIIGVHKSTVSNHLDINEALSKDEETELYNIFEDYIVKMQTTSCDAESKC